MDSEFNSELTLAYRDIRRFRAILESITVNVWVTNPDTQSTSIIAGLDELFGNIDASIEQRLSAIHPDDIALLRTEIEQSLSTRNPLDSVVRARDAAGDWRSLRLRAQPLLSGAGQLEEWVGVSTDVTREETARAELKLQQEILLASQERLTIALDASEMGVYECDFLNGKVLCTPEVERILGFKLEACSSESFFPNIHPDDCGRFAKEQNKAIQNSETMRCEFRVIRPDNSFRWISVTGQPYINGHGELIRMVGAVQDITDRRSANDWLRSQNKVLHQIATGAPLHEVLVEIVEMLEAGISESIGSLMLIENENHLVLSAGPNLPVGYVSAINGIEIGPNVGSCGTAAYLKEPVIAADIETDPRWADFKEIAKLHQLASCWSFPILTPLNCLSQIAQSSTAHSSAIQSNSRNTSESECRVLGAFAVYKRKPSDPTEQDRTRLNQAVQLASIALEKNRILESVRESEHRFRELANAMPQLVWTSDAYGNCNYGNRRLLETIGEKNLLDWQLAIHPDDRTHTVERFLTSMKTGEPYVTEHRLLVDATGEYRWYLSRATASKDSSGKIDCWYGGATDIDDLKRTEQALREERDRLSAIASTSPSALFSYVEYPDGRSCFPYASPAIEEIFGLKPSDVLNDDKRAREMIDPHDLQEILDLLSQSARTATPIQSIFRVNHPEKGLIWIECLAAPRTSPEGLVCWHGIFTDITRRKVMESRLLQSEKMEAIGRLAGGIAHDFNNLLTVIIGSCYLLENELQGSVAELSNLEAILHSSQRAAGLTKQLLAFSRQQEIVPQIVNLNELITNSELILQRLVGKETTLVIDLASDLHSVYADPSQLEQILINLVINSRDAISSQGTIKISARNTERTTGTHNSQLGESENSSNHYRYVEIEVSDSGHGMSVDIQKRIFEPFFTTKPIGKGTGLGLAVVHGIVTQNGGFIEVESNSGKGSSFRVLLPASSLNETKISDRKKDDYFSGGYETILIVDDEPEIAEIASKFLKTLGYHVLVAFSSDEAIQAFQNHFNKIDLLITDISMPGGTGDQLARILVQQKPDLPIIFMSGNEVSSLEIDTSICEKHSFIAKPFTPMELSNLIRNEIGKTK